MYNKKYHNSFIGATKKYEIRIKRIGSLLLESYVPVDSSDGIPLGQIPNDIKYLTPRGIL
ncbi:hypothetical protein BMR1_03g02576 [Babesia microti strain RI]|uniref:Uncharacterized protein n=1 Tax=Babesia microti (strain RI) TaxID=1133968 RepID=A0A1R4AC09_BABMR|nr:hypothetical protein BMR1_03g02576 [Babesia microti strain RI]SJK86475.1 hypothetical protein BMR1_03g02576 [Babesia microti strain RI]|eukprot:XP_021338632.1 hypothetical protein BMR1_03g02576 [Babesia microti strain RI]